MYKIRRCECGNLMYSSLKKCIECEEKSFNRWERFKIFVNRFLYVLMGVMLGYFWCWSQFN